MQATPQTPGTPQVPQFEVAPAAPGTAPRLVYRAARAHREELTQQQQALVRQRHDIIGELEDHELVGPARTGMEQRITQLDQRIAELDRAIAAADVRVAQAAAIPGVVIEPPPQEVVRGPPEAAFILATIFFGIALIPISIALARRILRKSAAAVTSLPRELSERLLRLEQTAEATAIEVERIGEGQRFVTRLLSEQAPGRALPAAASAARNESALGEARSL